MRAVLCDKCKTQKQDGTWHEVNFTSAKTTVSQQESDPLYQIEMDLCDTCWDELKRLVSDWQDGKNSRTEKPVPSPYPDTPVEQLMCKTCKHTELDADKLPCIYCRDNSLWEEKEV